jgi:hypothetical protein
MNQRTLPSAGDEPRGQILVIVAAGLLVLIAVVGLVIDGGHAWGQQRNGQNGVDAVVLGGAIMLAENQPFRIGGETVPNSDADIETELLEIAAKNELIYDEAFYTDFDGTPLPGPIEVGSLGAVPPPAEAFGVEGHGHRQFDTFLARVIGFTSFTANVTATAHTGPIVAAEGGTVLPVTFPVTITGCDGTNNPVADPAGDQWSLTPAGVYTNPYVVPLCNGDPGNVGWLDWDPPAGGMPDIIASIENPDNDEMWIPDWYYVAQTGNSSTPGLEDALNHYAVPPVPEEESPQGTVVFIPLFDASCEEDPDPGGVGEAAPDPEACEVGPGQGQDMWYHFNSWTAFEIDWVDLNGKSAKCNLSEEVPGTTGNGSTGCFQGWFRQYLGPGLLGPPTGDETSLTLWSIELTR